MKTVEKQRQNQLFENTEPQDLPQPPEFFGTVSLPFGERLITDQESEESDFKLSSEDQTDKSDSIIKQTSFDKGAFNEKWY